LGLSGGHPIILGKGIGKHSVKNAMNNEGMIVSFSKEMGNSLFQECEEECDNDCEFLKFQIACTPRVCLMFNLTTH
jgi:hypothetical protein